MRYCNNADAIIAASQGYLDNLYISEYEGIKQVNIMATI